MRFASYLTPNGEPALGRVDGSVLRRLSDVATIDTKVSLERLGSAQLSAKEVALDDVELLPAVPRPEKILCVGLNYRSHVDETGRDLPTYPVWFAKFASNLIGHGQPILCPPESVQVDYEAELAVVIGRPTRRVSINAAMDHVLGYTAANDVTVRDYQYKTHQWLQGKAWDSSTPLGPVLVTADELDPRCLDIRLRLNGTELQGSNTSRLIFDTARLVSLASEFTELHPGDVILTGTPSGVGYRRDPQVFLTDGDVVEVEVEGIGVLRNRVEAEEVQPQRSSRPAAEVSPAG